MGAHMALFDSLGEEFAWLLLDGTPDATVIVAESGQIVAANDHTAALFGVDIGTLLGSELEDLVPEGVRDAHRIHRRRFQVAPSVRSMGAGLRLSARRGDGSEFPVEVSLSPLHVGDAWFTVAAVRDVGRRLEDEASLAATQEELRRAEQAVVLAADRERVALGLHDTVIQQLFAAGMHLQGVVGAIDDTRVRTRVEATVELLDDTVKELRATIFALRPASARPDRLRGQLLDVMTHANSALGFDPRLQFDGPLDTVDDNIAMHLVPVLREALSNIARHAHAHRVGVTVTITDELTLTVSDDGDGLPDEVLGGSGLSNMASRAHALGGGFTIAPQMGGGSLLTWHVPADRTRPGQPTLPQSQQSSRHRPLREPGRQTLGTGPDPGP